MHNLIGAMTLASLMAASTLPALPWTDRGRIQGHWEVISFEDHGQPVDQLNGARYIFDNDKLVIRSPYFDLDGKAFHLNTSKEPREIDVVLDRSGVIRGIYKLQGDQLTLCTGDFRGGVSAQGALAGPRPTAFDSRQGSLVVLRRLTGKTTSKPTIAK